MMPKREIQRLREEYFGIIDQLAKGRNNLSNEAISSYTKRLSEIEEKIVKLYSDK